MQIIESIILGLIQGLTEFIPVSSSGHLVIAQYFFDGSSDHLFLEWINIGTFLALLVYFRGRIMGIISDIVLHRKYTLARNILITALPAGVIGFIAASFIAEVGFFGSIVTVLCGLVIVGIVMILLERIPKASNVDTLEHITVPRALFIGVLQVFALIPGVSRSGTTIIAGRLMGLRPTMAAEYSFLASIPIMSGVMLKLLLGGEERQYLLTHIEPLFIANLVAFLSSMIAIGLLMRYLGNHSLAIFGWYRLGLAAIVVLALLIQ